MSADDVQFVQAVVAEVKRSGRAFSRDALAACYYTDLKQRGAAEAPAASEKWIDYYWERLSIVSFAKLEQAAKSVPKLTDLLIELLGK